MSSARITLDNPVFAGRLRDFGRGTPFAHQPQVQQPHVKPVPRGISDVYVAPVAAARPAVVPVPVKPRLNRSEVLQRNITVAPTIEKQHSSTSTSQKILIAMASFIFMAGIGVAALGFKTNKNVEAQVQAVAQNNDQAGLPGEEKPDDAAMASHTVAPDQPRYIRINKINVYARITSQGIDKDGALKAPGNVHNAGWFNKSAKPGLPGAMLLDGHVSGPTQKGVFYYLKDLSEGDKIEVERGDGQIFSYSVVQSQTYDEETTDMTKAMKPVTDGKPGLNLITCTGKFDSKTGKYPQRLIVFAAQD